VRADETAAVAELRRDFTLFRALDGDRVRIGGRAVLYLEGQITL
jgi:hypothetical protein